MDKKLKVIKCMSEIIHGNRENLTINEENTETSDTETSGINGDCWYCHERANAKLTLFLREKINMYKQTAKELEIFDFIEEQDTITESIVDCDCFKKKFSLQNKPCHDDIQWKFIVICLKLLLATNNLSKQNYSFLKTEGEKHQPNFFGVNDEKSICAIIELITGLGICPNLLPGIGLPFQSKLEISNLLPKCNVHHGKLCVVLSVLLFIVRENMLTSIVLPSICCDLIAGMIQLRSCPEKLLGISVDCVCLELSNEKKCYKSVCKHEKKRFELELHRFLDNAYQPLIVRELLRLQRSCTKSGIRTNGWFLRVIGQLLSKCLLQENGVKMVIQGILEGVPTDSMSWQQHEAVGKVIARVPSQLSNANDYYSIISPQVLKLLTTESVKCIEKKAKKSNFLLVSVACIHEMLKLDHVLTQKYIFKSLLKPISLLLTDDDMVTLHEDSLLECLCSVHMVCTTGVINDKLVDVLVDVIQPLLILLTIMEGHNKMQILLLDISRHILENLKTAEFLSILNVYMFQRQDENAINHELTITLNKNNTIRTSDISTEQRIKCLIILLRHDKLKHQQGELFVSLLNQLASIQQKNVKAPCFSRQGKTSNELLEIDYTIEQLKYKIELVSFTSAMMDSFGHSVLQDTPQIISFMRNMLERSKLDEYTELGDVISENFHQQTVDMTLMLLSTLLGTDTLTSADFLLLNDLIPSLEKVSEYHENDSSRRMANDLKIFISTRGVIQSDRTESLPTKVFKDDESEYKAALDDLVSPLLPTRGHALLHLTNLLKLRNKYALDDFEKLLEVFETNLSHDDSYLYLSSIDGLVALADRHHRKVLPLLCYKFAKFNEKGNSSTSNELRMKLSEALIKTCQLCNEMLPMYTSTVLSALMTGVKDNDSAIRASSLAAIGEICKLLKFSIGSIVVEVFSCVRDILLTDKAIEVRRAAVQVFSLLFRGLESETLNSIPDVIGDIYRLLKRIHSIDNDDLTKLHANNALAILDDVMKDILHPGNKMEKVITI